MVTQRGVKHLYLWHERPWGHLELSPYQMCGWYTECRMEGNGSTLGKVFCNDRKLLAENIFSAIPNAYSKDLIFQWMHLNRCCLWAQQMEDFNFHNMKTTGTWSSLWVNLLISKNRGHRWDWFIQESYLGKWSFKSTLAGNKRSFPE